MDDSTRKIRRELLTGTTSIAVLAMLVKSREPLYGYQIGMRWINHEGETSEVNQGALYPVLRSLEKQELLTSEIIPSESGPPRKYYSPTALGRKVFHEWCAEWSKTKDWLDSILEPKHGRGQRLPTRST